MQIHQFLVVIFLTAAFFNMKKKLYVNYIGQNYIPKSDDNIAAGPWNRKMNSFFTILKLSQSLLSRWHIVTLSLRNPDIFGSESKPQIKSAEWAIFGKAEIKLGQSYLS